MTQDNQEEPRCHVCGDASAHVEGICLACQQGSPWVDFVRIGMSWVDPSRVVAVVTVVESGAERNSREPITPGYIRRQARRIETTYNRDTVMCAEHDWNHAATCAECKSEIAAGERRPDQQGQRVKKAIPAPDSVRQQMKQLLAAKDINASTAPTKEPQ